MACGPLGWGLAPGCVVGAATDAFQLVGGLILIGVGVLLLTRRMRLAGLVAAGAGVVVLVV